MPCSACWKIFAVKFQLEIGARLWFLRLINTLFQSLQVCLRKKINRGCLCVCCKPNSRKEAGIRFSRWWQGVNYLNRIVSSTIRSGFYLLPWGFHCILIRYHVKLRYASCPLEYLQQRYLEFNNSIQRLSLPSVYNLQQEFYTQMLLHWSCLAPQTVFVICDAKSLYRAIKSFLLEK